MTVCIAAICENGKGLVSASDMMISMGWVSGDTKAAKNLWVADDWNAMFAGGDISPAQSIIDSVRKKLSGKTVDLSMITNAFKGAYQEQLREEATDKVLARYGWDLNSFLQNGYRALGPEEFAKTLREYNDVKLECEFLIYGSDPDREGHILTVSNPGISSDRSALGFWAIGSGEYMALASLMTRRGLIGTQSAEIVTYYVCEAKFMAESATGVGKTSIVVAQKFQGDGKSVFSFLAAQQMKPINEAWLKDIKGKLPTDIEGIMKSCMKWETR